MPKPTTIGGAIVAVVILLGLFLYYKFGRKNNTKNEEALNEFLESLSGQIESMITKIISSIDITQYTTLEELELDIFHIAYKDVWSFVSEQVSIALGNNSISPIIGSLLTQERVEKFIELIIERCGLMSVAATNWNKRIEVASQEAEQFEKDVADKNKAYEDGKMDIDEKNFVAEEYKDENVNGELIPPSEEEQAYDEDDISQEIVEDEEVEPDVMPESKTDVFDELVDPEDEEEA